MLRWSAVMRQTARAGADELLASVRTVAHVNNIGVVMSFTALSNSMSSESLFDLRGRVALVTGASSGIGLHLAGVLAEAGASVALSARRRERVDSAAQDLRNRQLTAISIPLDVTNAESVESGLDTIAKEFGRSPDVLINCAGILVTKPFLEQTEHDFDSVIRTNLRGAFFMAQRVAAGMVHRGQGSIINVASTAGLRVGGYLSSYGASKAALIHLTKGMALELARFGIRANVLCPGNFDTDMHQSFVERGFAESMRSRIPQRRFGQPQDLDGAALLLASDAGRYITGAVLAIDGGQLVSSL